MQAVLVAPDLLVPTRLFSEAHLEPGTKHCLRPQQMLELSLRELGAVEIALVRPETQGGTRVRTPDGSNLLQLRDLLAVGEGHVVLLALAPNPDLQVLGQRIHHRNADAVQSAGKLVVVRGELAAGVQLGEDHLHTGQPLLGVQVHRHATAVVPDLQGSVLEQLDLDVAGEAGDGLVHAVVYHLLGQVVGASGVRVHTRALAHRIEPAQDFDG